ncbi:alpha,alpha-trehalose-phosphate synthase (UDP-forming) [Microvirga lenta]|uniref:alpha,alpha-trehalose-phosphate synthase (UDP-forming) n=1 Tax=Microvirga lenta TaxID=2881337 RepID=UPI001CFF8D9B|nr:alpha,alpha-trehalose-phosphate synthase (UDP-forming) [Microvirga lenta]MCB5177371.1 alpha,alpha-trehalose-phosphate synthase (UDP-forming) [Microvirga lenta]
MKSSTKARAAENERLDRVELARGNPSGRLVVVSNRVPLPTKDGTSSAGGLAVALEGALKQQGGLWFGWSGRTVDRAENMPHIVEAGNITFAVLDVLKKDFDLFYTGFANRVLWPICHYRLDLLQIDRSQTEGYFRVNRTFAEALAPLLNADDTIWIHDYHFIPLAAELRRLGCRNRIGFFLHIPWPPSDVASALPSYERLLNGLASYDVVGFHTPQDAENFRQCLMRERIGFPVGNGEYQVDSHRFKIGSFPVGIETDAFAQTAASAERNPVVRRMRASMGNRDLIIGVDRLDYSKGIKQRIEAFACCVRSNPELRNRVVYLQVTPKSRSDVPEYKKMQHEIAEQAGWTNGNLGEVDWTPIRYLNKTIGHTQLAGLYRMARVGLVTPLRDGMNLVAKEFVASQDPDDPGVLVLSRFAGAMHELDAALLVNPYDTEATAAAIARAVEMPLEERKERWNALMIRLRSNGIDNWCRSFLTALCDDLPAAPEGDRGGSGRPRNRVAHAPG